MADVSDEPRALATLPTELLTLMAEHLDEHSLAHFAAASTVCLAAAHSELRASLVAAVERCVVPGGRISNALAACPYFRLPDDLVVLPERALMPCLMHCTSLTQLTLPAALINTAHWCVTARHGPVCVCVCVYVNMYTSVRYAVMILRHFQLYQGGIV